MTSDDRRASYPLGGASTLGSWRRASAAAAAGVLYALSQPGWGIWPLAFVCLTPLLFALQDQGPVRRAFWGWLAGTLATGFATVVPAAVGSSAYFDLPLWQALVIAATVGQVFGAGSFALAAWLAGDPARHGASWPLRAAAAWIGAEWLRSHLFTGLPWLLVAQALTPAPALIQLAAWAGSAAVALPVVAANAALAWGPIHRERRGALAWLGLVSAALVLSSLLVPETGGLRALAPGEGAVRGLRVQLVQGRVPNAWRGDPRRVRESLATLVDVTRRGGDADLLIWPENAASFVLPVNRELVATALASLEPVPAAVLLGGPRADPRAPGRLYNSAMLFDAEAGLLAHHDKVHLLPFAEYAPAPWSWLVGNSGDTAAGEQPRAVPVLGTVLGPLVCYEVAFPWIARAQAAQGAGILVNLSNDGWFGTTGAVEQHFSAAILRAVENRRPLLRATNTGVTAAVDRAGRVVARAPLDAPATLRFEVEPSVERSLYTRLGDWLSPLAAGSVGLWLARDRRRRARLESA